MKSLRPRVGATLRVGPAPAPHRAAPIYTSPEWRQFIGAIIRKRGRRCEDCERTGCRIFGDHIVELKDGGEPFEETNIRLLCGSCHTAKTARARAARR
ncbi:MAG TPA: HNH endonuclease signature motif containing protein [Stellaceae bacterium]|nr:HNH endonuclease signature motif containing protein [Stellaceae bacterium]